MKSTAPSAIAITLVFCLAPQTSHADDYNSGVISGRNHQAMVSKSPAGENTQVEYGSGWYLRGDLSYNFHGDSKTSIKTLDTSVGQRSLDAEYDDAVGFRVGAGYYIAPNLRLELSGESVLDSRFSGTFGTNFAGSRAYDVLVTTGGTTTTISDTVSFDSSGNVTGTTGNAFTGTSVPPISGTEEIDSRYNASLFVANAYYDLPTIGRFTPYIGAGLGLGYINQEETRRLTCVAAASETCGYPVASQGETAETSIVLSERYFRPVYQISAGTAYRLNERLSMDVGYSWTRVGQGGELSYSDGTALNDNGVDLHQFRAGLRYELW